jgi:hypothetical protein
LQTIGAFLNAPVIEMKNFKARSNISTDNFVEASQKSIRKESSGLSSTASAVGWQDTHRDRGIDIHCTPFPVFCVDQTAR